MSAKNSVSLQGSLRFTRVSPRRNRIQRNNFGRHGIQSRDLASPMDEIRKSDPVPVSPARPLTNGGAPPLPGQSGGRRALPSQASWVRRLGIGRCERGTPCRTLCSSTQSPLETGHGSSRRSAQMEVIGRLVLSGSESERRSAAARMTRSRECATSRLVPRRRGVVHTRNHQDAEYPCRNNGHVASLCHRRLRTALFAVAIPRGFAHDHTLTMGAA